MFISHGVVSTILLCFWNTNYTTFFILHCVLWVSIILVCLDSYTNVRGIRLSSDFFQLTYLSCGEFNAWQYLLVNFAIQMRFPRSIPFDESPLSIYLYELIIGKGSWALLSKNLKFSQKTKPFIIPLWQYMKSIMDDLVKVVICEE